MRILLFAFCVFSFFPILWCTRFPFVEQKAEGADSSARCFPEDPVRAALADTLRGALLGTRFGSLEALKKLVDIEYEGHFNEQTGACSDCFVRLRYCNKGREISSVLESGISQGDILKARHGTFWARLSMVLGNPNTVRNRKDLGRANALSRLRPQWFGAGDVAFFNLARLMYQHINTPHLAIVVARDTTEKGYVNSFNHILSQAFFTSCFSETLADFIGDAHERANHPELITGRFSETQLKDLEEGPVDNYVDVLNNGWGQQMGILLKRKYRLHHETHWTPELLTHYLNDMQAYFSWAFRIGFEPFREEDEAVRQFCTKLNEVMQGTGRLYD